jgi:hypothetical protein
MRQLLIEKYLEPNKFEDKRYYVNEEGRHHSFLGQPAFVEYVGNKVLIQYWCKNGLNHRERDNPAIIQYNINERVICREWIKNGKLHRLGGKPAIIYYDDNGKVTRQECFENGKYF